MRLGGDGRVWRTSGDGKGIVDNVIIHLPAAGSHDTALANFP
jgi:hypothetical protein